MILSSVPGRKELDARLAAAEAAARGRRPRDGIDDETLLDLAAEVGELHERIDHFERFFGEHEALAILAGLGFGTGDEQRDIGELSGGWKMRGVLAGLLFQRPDVLLLDEPTNHLDMPSVAWFSDFLKKWNRCFILICARPRVPERADLARRQPRARGRCAATRATTTSTSPQRAEEETILEGRAEEPRARARAADRLHQPVPRAGEQGQGGAVAGQVAREDGVGRDLPEAPA